MINREFLFNIKEHEILPFVLNINDWIDEKLNGDHLACEVIFFKSKLILTELITNAIKHAHTNEFKLNIEIDQKFIKVTRIDKGEPFGLFSDGQALMWPLPAQFFNKPLMILKDKMSNMFAVIKDHYSIEFKLEEYSKKDEEVINTLLEHFGLIIITKLSDEFTYMYDPANQ